MIFQLGKVKPLAERSVEAETLRRWREVSLGDETVVKERDLEGWKIADDPRIYDEEETLTSAPMISRQGSAKSESDVSARDAVRGDSQWSVELRPNMDEDLQRRFGGNLRSALGPGTVIEGKFSFDSPVRIDGTLIGEVNSTSALIVGETATVNATIRVGSIIVLGAVSGPVEASELVEIRDGGSLEGNIRTERIAIQDGGHFCGSCNMGQKRNNF